MLETVLTDPIVDHIKNIEHGQNENFWSFKNSTRRSGAHALIHYPAMMVPTLQGKLLDAIRMSNPNAKNILDPFVGSGTVLVESMSRGLNFTGIDINPLAVLACLAKSGPYFIQDFNEKSECLLARISADRGRSYYTDFSGRDKWFSDSTSLALSKIARAIEKEPELWARRMFWLAMAKVVRGSCNSRMSTYKLHIKPDNACVKVDPIELFKKVLINFSRNINLQQAVWTADGLLKDGEYTGLVDINLGDSRMLLEKESHSMEFDVVMTSPPYGDNSTTIPYGQYSYLPMQWISKDDISSELAPSLLKNTHAIDSASLGGSCRGAIARGIELANKYESARVFTQEMVQNSSAYKRFSAFFADLEDCLDKVCSVTKSGGYQAWTIGNRHLGGRRVPMENILDEMLAERNVDTVARIRRSIHAKKMPHRNNFTPTMNTETVILARKKTP